MRLPEMVVGVWEMVMEKVSRERIWRKHCSRFVGVVSVGFDAVVSVVFSVDSLFPWQAMINEVANKNRIVRMSFGKDNKISYQLELEAKSFSRSWRGKWDQG